MAKTFDNISEASGTNYLFLFAQRTLAHQNEPPTPPPLNVVGLPCYAICRFWAWLYPNKAAANKYLSIYLSIRPVAPTETVAAVTVVTAANNPIEASPPPPPTSPPEMALSEKAVVEHKEKLKAAANVAADKVSSNDKVSTQAEETLVEVKAVLKASVAVVAVGEAPVKATATPLAEKITEYIIDHQDDAAQEDRWRTIMKRDMSKSFRLLREESAKQREAIAKQREAIDEVRQLVKNLACSVLLPQVFGITGQVSGVSCLSVFS